ncbi:MAG: Wzz/FepE/Etk N-terminal domain-containing protein [Bacteroidota bacterium]
MDTPNQIIKNEEFEGIDFDKALNVLQKSIIWVILIIFSTTLVAYLSVRWTKPMYESSSQLKLDVEANASELGITALGESNNINVISGEIELIRSKLFFNKVIDNIDLNISYYTTGNVLNDEKYRTSPFLVKYDLKNGSLYDRPVYVDIIDKSKFMLSFFDSDMTNAKTFNFGEKITFQGNELSLYLTTYYKPEEDFKHFFRINSRSSQLRYLESNLIVEPLNLNANTIKISFRDYNQFKARDLVDAIDSLYLAYSQEEKNLENTKKINWLNQELKEIEGQLEGYEDYFEEFTIENRTSNLDLDLTKTIEAINEIDSQRYQLDLRIRSARRILSSVQNESNSTEVGAIDEVNVQGFPSNIVTSFRKLQELRQEKELLLLSYEQTTLAIISKDREIETLQSSTENQVTTLIKSYLETKKYLESQKAQLQKNSS